MATIGENRRVLTWIFVLQISKKELSDLAYDSAISLIGSERVHRGLIATGDQFIASKEYVEKLQKDFDAYACEMEGAAIAKVCTAYEKPFCVIRTLSDKADGEAQDTYVSFGDEAADQSNRIVMKMLESL
ncbi:MAG: 5'-methylthioadenosine/S-adenosylhomocysteine nucleosidase [Bacilli bacterium]|nr:5'-methylthioadenosine/S-adenosylhomocysteine nucleosidase [Bacilli bacterium]